MYYETIINVLADRKRKLGMTEAYIAKKAKISQPTVHRILSGQHKKAAWDDIIKIGAVLGMKCKTLQVEFEPIEEMLDYQAGMLASITVALNNATNQMEGQGFSLDEQNRLIFEAKSRWLSGTRRNIWG